MAKSPVYYLRKTHRYLGVFIGIQFLAWTTGGLYFSWNSIDEIHGDHLRNFESAIIETKVLQSPSEIISQLDDFISLKNIDLISLFDTTYYRLIYLNKQNETRVVLTNARTGKIKPPLRKEEALKLAEKAFKPEITTYDITYIESTDSHHEYRGLPLPVWKVSFGDSERTHVYISAEYGEVIRFRTERWRWFDWLYMLHTMDYQGRDDFNNLLLKSFSILGLVTVTSGFILFLVTSKVYRKWKYGA